MVIVDESRDDCVKIIEDIFQKLKNIRDVFLHIYFIGRGVSTVIPKIKEVLLSNLSIPVRLYIFQNIEDLLKAFDLDSRECSEMSVHLVSSGNYEEVVFKYLKEKGISEINIC